MTLTNKQQRFLRSKAHHLKPVIITGNAGVSDALINETNLALETHELIKVRINAENKEDKTDMANHLAQITESKLIQLIGHIAILYRQRSKDPEIKLPKD